MSSPKTFDEVAKEIAQEKGIILEKEPEVEELELSPSIIDEDNRKVRKVMKTLEEWGWHYSIQEKIKLYIHCSETKRNIANVDKDGNKYNSRTPFVFRHQEIDERLFIYQSAVNTAIRNEDYNFSLRKKIIIFLGCRCLFCGNEDIDYLQLDHKDSRGGKERKDFKKRGLNPMLYYWNNLINAYLKLQVLCLKCHRLKSTYRISQEDIDKAKDTKI